MKNNTPKNGSVKRQVSKLPLSSSKKKAAAKKPIAARAARTRSRNYKTRTLVIRLGLRTRLELTLRRAPKKRKITKKPKAAVPLSRSLQASFFIVFGLLGCVYFAMNVVEPKSPPPISVQTVPAPVAKLPSKLEPLGMTPSEPTELSIPDAAIQTSLLTVGRNADNTIQVPESYEAAGWYRYSPTPGEIGPTIIVGHVDSYRGPAVFWRLSQLQPAQLVKIKRADGQTITYQVTEVKQFDQNNFPTTEVYGNISHAGLRLITCGGAYNRATNRYSHNTVVYATMLPKPASRPTKPQIKTTLINLLKSTDTSYLVPIAPVPFTYN